MMEMKPQNILSSGFAFIHANSVADVIAVEAVTVDHIDQSLVQKMLTKFTQKLTNVSRISSFCIFCHGKLVSFSKLSS